MTEEKKPDDELGVLFPDVELTVTDPDTREPVDLVVREFRFAEGMKAQVVARPMIEALAELVGNDGDIGLDSVMEMMAEHADTWIGLIGLASDRDPGWISRLSSTDGDAIAEATWSANQDFLARRVVATAARKKRLEQQPKKKPGSRSRKSSTRSSGPDTA